MKNIFLFCTLIFCSAAVFSDTRTIAVTGKGHYEVPPDVLLIDFGFVRKNVSDIAAAKNSINKQVHDLFNALKTLGVDINAISSQGLEIDNEPYYDIDECDTEPKPAVAQAFSLKLTPIDKYNEVINALTNANVSHIERVKGELSNYPLHEREALKMALSNAKTEAAFLVEGLGGKLGKVYSIGEKKIRNQFLVEEVLVTGVRASKNSVDSIDFKPKPVSVNAEVYVEFEINP